MTRNYTMDFDSEYSETTAETCKCGRVIEVSGQKDNCPEYVITIYVRCACGLSVEFNLPVN